MKLNMASKLAIFMAALLRKNAPLMVSNGLDLVLARLSSSSSNLSNIVYKIKTQCFMDTILNLSRQLPYTAKLVAASLVDRIGSHHQLSIF